MKHDLNELAGLLLRNQHIKSRMGMDHLLIFVPVGDSRYSDRIGVKADGQISLSGCITHAVIDVLEFIRDWQQSIQKGPDDADA